MASYITPEIVESFKYFDQYSGHVTFNSPMSFVRLNKWPLDLYSRFRNQDEAWNFIGDPNNPSYPGQIISTYNVPGVPNSALPSSKADGKYRLYVVTKDESKPNGLGLREFSGTEDAFRIINYIPNYLDGTESSTRLLNSDVSSGPLTFAAGNENISFSWVSDNLKNILRISSSDYKVETKKESNTKIWISGVKQVLDSSITINAFDPSIFITENPGEMVIPIINSSVSNIDKIVVKDASIENASIKNNVVTNSSILNSSIQNGYVFKERVENSSVVNQNVQNSSIQNGYIFSERVENSSIVNSSITNSTIENSSIQNGYVFTENVVNSSIQNSSIQNSYVVNQKVENSSINNLYSSNAKIDYIEAIDISINGSSLADIAALGPFFKLSLDNPSYDPVRENPKIILSPESKDLDDEYYLQSMFFNQATSKWENIPNSSVGCTENVFAYDSKRIPEWLNSFSVLETANLECVRQINLIEDSSWYGDIIQSLWPIYEFADANKLEYKYLKVGIALFNNKGRCSEILAIKFEPKCIGLDQNNKYLYKIEFTIF